MMPMGRATGVSRLAGWIALSALVFLVRGVGPGAAAWALVLLPLVLTPEKTDPGPVSVLLLGGAAIAFPYAAFAVLTGAAALVMLWKSGTLFPRVAGALSAAACALVISMGYQAPDATGFPPAQEVHVDDATVWYNVPSLNSGSQGVTFRTSDGGSFRISMEAGGVRDTMPLASLRAGESVFCINSGTSSLEIDLAPGGENVTVTITRPWQPFQHPVLHFNSVRLVTGDSQ